jgi:hypothetical protein
VIFELHMIDNFLMENFFQSLNHALPFQCALFPKSLVICYDLCVYDMADNRQHQRQRQHQRRVANAPPEEAPAANSGEEMEIDPSPADLKIFQPDFGTLIAEPSMSSIVNPSVGEDDDVAGNVIV